MVQGNPISVEPLKIEPLKKPVNILRILAIIGIVLILALAVSAATWINTYHNLTASVKYDGTRFNIQNEDNFKWTDVRLLLNSDYKFNTSDILEHNGFSVEAGQFAKDDGTKFDPAVMSPTDLYIVARISDNQWSSWFYKFN